MSSPDPSSMIPITMRIAKAISFPKVNESWIRVAHFTLPQFINMVSAEGENKSYFIQQITQYYQFYMCDRFVYHDYIPKAEMLAKPMINNCTDPSSADIMLVRVRNRNGKQQVYR